jgi:iron complex transport system substrate-binding protein
MIRESGDLPRADESSFARKETLVKRRSIAGLLALVLTLAGCAGGSSASHLSTSVAGSSATMTYPLTITDDDGATVTIDHQPERIVTFAPSMTEIVFALGLGDRLVGVAGAYDNYPPQAKGIDQVGGAGDFGVDPNVEKVVALQPDLFLTIAGGDQWKQKLRDLGVPVVTYNATDLPDLLHDIDAIGRIVGVPNVAQALTSRMSDRADAVAQQVQSEGRVTCFFETYYPPLQTVGPGTFIYDLLERAGCDPVTASAKSDYPQWSVDELVAHPPQVYLATPESAKSVAAIARRPAFGDIPAIANGSVALIDADLVTRPGPRVIDGIEQLAAALHPQGV